MDQITIDGFTFETPPAIYAHEPERDYRITTVSKRILAILCKPETGRVILGCTLETDPPVIFVIEGVSSDLRAALIEHEKAHINGWRH